MLKSVTDLELVKQIAVPLKLVLLKIGCSPLLSDTDSRLSEDIFAAPPSDTYVNPD